MSTQVYLDLAQQACKVENEKQWLAAAQLWQLAFEVISPDHPNSHWAKIRTEFCLGRKKYAGHSYRT